MLSKIMVQLGTVYVMLWVTNFVKTGQLESNAEAKTYYKNTMTIAVCIGIFLLPLGGKMGQTKVL